MQVVHGRDAYLAVLAVDPADRDLDVVPQLAVLLHALPAGTGHLDQYRAGRSEPALVQHLAVGVQPVQDALGVVQPVDAEQHDVRFAQGLAELLGAGPHIRLAGDLLEAARVDRDGERRGADVAPAQEVVVRHPLAPDAPPGDLGGRVVELGVWGPGSANPRVASPADRRQARRKLVASL